MNRTIRDCLTCTYLILDVLFVILQTDQSLSLRKTLVQETTTCLIIPHILDLALFDYLSLVIQSV